MGEPELVEEFVHLTERQRAVRAIVLGALLGVLLVAVGRSRASRRD